MITIMTIVRKMPPLLMIEAMQRRSDGYNDGDCGKDGDVVVIEKGC